MYILVQIYMYILVQKHVYINTNTNKYVISTHRLNISYFFNILFLCIFDEVKDLFRFTDRFIRYFPYAI